MHNVPANVQKNVFCPHLDAGFVSKPPLAILFSLCWLEERAAAEVESWLPGWLGADHNGAKAKHTFEC